jgi:hypothetical protein
MHSSTEHAAVGQVGVLVAGMDIVVRMWLEARRCGLELTFPRGVMVVADALYVSGF